MTRKEWAFWIIACWAVQIPLYFWNQYGSATHASPTFDVLYGCVWAILTTIRSVWISGKPAPADPEILIEPEFVLRDSTGPAPGADDL